MARDRRPRDDEDFEDDRPRRAPRRQPRDDDDDFEEVERPRPKPAGGNTAVKVLAIVGVVLLGITLICSGATFLVYRSIANGVNDVQQKMQQDMAKKAVERQKVMDQEMAKAGDAMQKRQADRMYPDKVNAATAAEAFVQEVKGGRAGAAYQKLSVGYRARTTEAEFAKVVAANSAGMASTRRVEADIFAPDTGTTFTFALWAAGKTVRLTAIRENDAWAIEQFTVTAK